MHFILLLTCIYLFVHFSGHDFIESVFTLVLLHVCLLCYIKIKSSILLNRDAKLRSHTKTPFIGEIAHHRTWYTPLYHPEASSVRRSRYSSTIHISFLLRRSLLQMLQSFFPLSVMAWQSSQLPTHSLIALIFSLKSLEIFFGWFCLFILFCYN